MEKSIRLYIILSLATFSITFANDVCYSPFSQFLQCMANEADKKLQRYLNELSPAVKQETRQCFLKSSCTPPDFSQATIDTFLQPPWNERAKIMLDLLENIDPKVKECMINYFKGIIKDKVEECVKQEGPADIKDFQMPPLPDVHNTDITKFKEVVLNRMVVRESITQCSDDRGGATANRTIDCIAQARNQHDQTMCVAREQCKASKIPDSKCQERFDKVHETACKCVQEKKSRYAANATRIIISGELEKQFKKCHTDNNVPYVQEKVDKVKETIQTILGEMLAHKPIPDSVKRTMRVAKEAFKDVAEQWKGAFCAKCSKNGDQSSITVTDKEIEDLKKTLGEKKEKGS